MNTTKTIFVAAETVDEALSIFQSQSCRPTKKDVRIITSKLRKNGWPRTESWELTITAKKLPD